MTKDHKTKIQRLGDALLPPIIDINTISSYARSGRSLPEDAQTIRELGKRVAILSIRLAEKIEKVRN